MRIFTFCIVVSTVFGIFQISACENFNKKKNSSETPTFNGRIPSGWDGKSDWQGSTLKAKDHDR